jgi:hypothetical protein
MRLATPLRHHHDMDTFAALRVKACTNFRLLTRASFSRMLEMLNFLPRSFCVSRERPLEQYTRLTLEGVT